MQTFLKLKVSELSCVQLLVSFTRGSLAAKLSSSLLS